MHFNDGLRVETYTPQLHTSALNNYMAFTDVENNKSPKILRLAEYDNEKGALFLVLNQDDKICALSSVVTEKGLNGPCAKIYGRFHITAGTSHTIIDRFFEPMTFQWCLDRGIRDVFLTINAGRHSVLDWACRRMGERRNVFRSNRFFPALGPEIRSGFVPHHRLIYERNCWQYVIYFSSSGGFFVEREERALDPEALAIFQREFPHATQDWNRLF